MDDDREPKSRHKMVIPSALGTPDPTIPHLPPKVIHGIKCYWSRRLQMYTSTPEADERAYAERIGTNPYNSRVPRKSRPKKHHPTFLESDFNGGTDSWQQKVA